MRFSCRVCRISFDMCEGKSMSSFVFAIARRRKSELILSEENIHSLVCGIRMDPKLEWKNSLFVEKKCCIYN